MSVFRFYLAILVLASQFALAGSVATPEWSYVPGEGVGQLAPFPDAEHAEGVLVTGSSGRIRLVAPGGRELSSMQIDLPPTTNAIPVIFRRGEEARIVVADNEGSIYCFRRNGERLWKYSRGTKGNDFRVLTVADLEGRGVNEIVMSDTLGHLYAVDASGHLRFEVTATNFRVSPAAAAKIDGQSGAIIVFGTDDKDLYAVRASGEVLWHAHVEGAIGRSLPVIASLGSGGPVALVTIPFVGTFQGLDARNARTGKMLWHAPSLLQSYQSIAVADIDGDGAPEILYGDKSDRVYCVDAHGRPRWEVHLDGRGIFFTPAIADLEGKGRATLFQVVRATGTNGKSLYALDASGGILDSWPLPGGGGGPPILVRWQNDSEVHMLVAGGSGKLTAYRLAQNPSAKILWTGLQGSFAAPPPSPSGASASPAGASAAATKVMNVSLGTTNLEEPSKGAPLVALRVADPDGAIHLTLLKPEAGEAVAGELLAPKPGNYELTAEWLGTDSAPLRTERATYRASAELNLSVPAAPGELAAYVKARFPPRANWLSNPEN